MIILSPAVIYAQVFDKEWPEKEGFIRVMKITDFNGIKIPLYGFLKNDRSVFIPCIYDYASDFSCGLAVVGSLSMSLYEIDDIYMWLQPKYSYINTRGENLNYKFEFATSVNKDTESILIGVPFLPYMRDPANYQFTKYQYQEIPLSILKSSVGHQKDLNIPKSYRYWGDYKYKDNADIYSESYNLSIPIEGYHHKYFKYSSNKIPASYSDHSKIETIKDTIANQYVIVIQHGLCGIRNTESSSFLIPCMFEDIKELGHGKIGVKRYKWAILDKSGKYLTDFIFDKIEGILNDNDTFAKVSKIDYRLDYGPSWKYVFKTYSLSETNLNSVIDTYFKSK